MWTRAPLTLLALFTTFVLAAAVAQAAEAAKYNFTTFPTVGKPGTAFRVSFTAPAAIDGNNTDYILEGVGPRGCPTLYEFVGHRVSRGDRVVMRLTAFDDLYFNERQLWCRGSYFGYVYYSGTSDDKLVGYVRFGVGRVPVSLEP
jgi:hypothetical protein